MEIIKILDVYTAFSRMLVLASRYDFCALYRSPSGHTVCVTNNAAEFNELVAPGFVVARVIIGKLHISDVDQDERSEFQYLARRFNENISYN